MESGHENAGNGTPQQAPPKAGRLRGQAALRRMSSFFADQVYRSSAKSVKAMVNLFEGASNAITTKLGTKKRAASGASVASAGSQSGNASRLSLVSRPRSEFAPEENDLNLLEAKAYMAESPPAGRSADRPEPIVIKKNDGPITKEDKRLSEAGVETPTQQLEILMEQLERLTAEGGNCPDSPTLGYPNLPQEQQETKPRPQERRDPREVKKFWDNVRARLWIDDDELDEEPAVGEQNGRISTESEFYLDQSGTLNRGTAPNTSKSASADRGLNTSHGVLTKSATPNTLDILYPPDSNVSPVSPFGTGPVLKSLKQHWSEKEAAEAALCKAIGGHKDLSAAQATSVKRALPIPGVLGSSPPMISGGGQLLMPPPDRPLPRIPERKGSSTRPMSKKVPGDSPEQLPTLTRRAPSAQQLGSSPPPMPSSEYSLQGTDDSFVRQGHRLNPSSPPVSADEEPYSAAAVMRYPDEHFKEDFDAQFEEQELPLPLHVNKSTAANGMQHKEPEAPHPLSLDKYRHLYAEPEECEQVRRGDVRKLQARMPVPEHYGASQERPGQESFQSRQRAPLPPIDTHRANRSNMANLPKPSRRFDLLEGDEDRLSTPILPRLPQLQGGAADRSKHAARKAENRITRWPTLEQPLAIGGGSSSAVSGTEIGPAAAGTGPGNGMTNPRVHRTSVRRTARTTQIGAPPMSSSPPASSVFRMSAGSQVIPPSPGPPPSYPPPPIPVGRRPQSRKQSNMSTPKSPEEKISELDEYFCDKDKEVMERR